MNEELISFPLNFPLVVVCLNDDTVIKKVIDSIKEQCSAFKETESLETSKSSSSKYISLRITAYVTSQEHLDSLYMSIKKIDGVKFLL